MAHNTIILCLVYSTCDAARSEGKENWEKMEKKIPEADGFGELREEGLYWETTTHGGFCGM